MNIAEVAKAAALPAKTIRYYEDIGLIRPQRGANGYRHFRDSDLHKLVFLGRARSLGFSIEDCRALLALYEDQSRASGDVKALAVQHLQQVRAKMADGSQACIPVTANKQPLGGTCDASDACGSGLERGAGLNGEGFQA